MHDDMHRLADFVSRQLNAVALSAFDDSDGHTPKNLCQSSRIGELREFVAVSRPHRLADFAT